MNKKLINLGALAIIALGGSVLATTGNAQEPLAPGDADTVTARCTSASGAVAEGASCSTSSDGNCTCT